MLRAAQAFGLARRIERGRGPVLPCQAAQAGLVMRGQGARRGGQHAAVAFHHHAAHLGQRGADQRDAGIRIVPRHIAHPFGARAGLAEAATGADQPDAPRPPGIGRRQLRIARPAFPVIAAQRGQFVRGEHGAQQRAVHRALAPAAPKPYAAGRDRRGSLRRHVRAPAHLTPAHVSPPVCARHGWPRHSPARAGAACRSSR